MSGTEQQLSSYPRANAPSWPILICLLGDFLLLKEDQPITIPAGGKIASLLCLLGLRYQRRISRDSLLSALWPDSNPILANQSLNSLIYSLHKLIGDGLGGATPVVHEEGYYRLNTEAGVGVDIVYFDSLVTMGEKQAHMSEYSAAAQFYCRAVDLYRGDLCVTADVQAVMERERLRARYLTLLAYLANYYYNAGNYAACTEYVWRLLVHDPYREDAHRLAMRCYVQRGERAAALRHYRICVDLLRGEFDTTPEPATMALFEQIRLKPDSI